MNVFVEAADCLTCFGDSRATAAALLAGTCGLQLSPVLGPDGGDLVPLALRGAMETPVPPRWWPDLLSLLNAVPDYPWGTPRFPILFASSNYGIDSMYALSRNRNIIGQHSWANAGLVVSNLCSAMGWGSVTSSFSHACVSAHLAALQGERMLRMGLAEKVLLVAFDFLGPFVTAGFHALKILNDGLPAPYRDADTGSIGLGDGAAWAVLGQTLSKWRVAAGSVGNEMFHFTANEPGGTGFRAALQPFVDLQREFTFWVKGHGTGTLEAGRLESEAVADCLAGVSLVSWKGAIGHTLGSCALVEAAVAMRVHEQGTIPGTIGTQPPVFADCVATANFSAERFNALLLLCNAFGGAHGGWLLHYVD